jgi:EAL domain
MQLRTFWMLGGLREASVRIALDNFGTGYSSLYHLRNFKMDKIKIDGSFIHGMLSEKEDAGIVQALVGLAHRALCLRGRSRERLCGLFELSVHGQALSRVEETISSTWLTGFAKFRSHKAFH